jgi:small subunit ribosomal protein S4
MGFSDSRAQARQLVNHGIFSVNGRKTDIPSRILRPNDEISVTVSKKKLKYFEDFESRKPREEYSWVEADFKNLKGKYLTWPIREQLDPEIKEQLIVEFYSK